MKFIISVRSKKGIEPFEYELNDYTEVGSKLNINNIEYRVEEININPESKIINIICSVKPNNDLKNLTTTYR